MSLRSLTALGAALVLFVSGCAPRYSAEAPPAELSAFELYEGDPRLQKPAQGVVPYELSTPLFSDYANKHRLVKLPNGQAARYDDEEAFDFPVGTVISKTFSYPLDAKDPAGPQRLIETRILLRGDSGWVGLPYVWNEEQTEAVLEVTGGRAEVNIERGGVELALDYRVPNANQCKGCHRTKDREMLPIGPRAGLLNHAIEYDHGRENQLDYWTRAGLIQDAPPSDQVPSWPTWDDPTSGSLDHRARAWLDINCAHCHNPEGPARTSGLDLRFSQSNPTLWGVDKSPVAAGRGSGDRLVDIAPGDPGGSILLYRLESVDPGEMMPELGRSIVHRESIDLIRQWIAEMPGTSPSRTGP